ncbi:MAG TPA: hypothetical protein VFE68_17765, partial [Vicinamibacteria bacterium]|nr:hypothetical protein [Vicinamibacteria bacterium]
MTMKRRDVLLLMGGSAVAAAALDLGEVEAQTDHPRAKAGEPVKNWADKAEALMPRLTETEQRPL